MKPVQFESSAYQDYIDWAKANEDIFDKINKLIIDIDRNLFKGLGKPEPLKGNLKSYWSRRITDEHRLVYKIEKSVIYIYSCHGHYDK
jgi:toxin YoeB